ncbi:hypothetical protein OHB26_33745 [Nocardia sp. NBC_01503]|nr:hypothetical protein [Nocardia sp. NBC_01503]WTL31812.1 hypothetical protein OHB26_33745 [Nocardia sp. NBC_01503]
MVAIETYVLEHVSSQYRRHLEFVHTGGVTDVELPIAVKLDWDRLAELAR